MPTAKHIITTYDKQGMSHQIALNDGNELNFKVTVYNNGLKVRNDFNENLSSIYKDIKNHPIIDIFVRTISARCISVEMYYDNYTSKNIHKIYRFSVDTFQYYSNNAIRLSKHGEILKSNNFMEVIYPLILKWLVESVKIDFDIEIKVKSDSPQLIR